MNPQRLSIARKTFLFVSVLILPVYLAACAAEGDAGASAPATMQSADGAPSFAFDATWPAQPLANDWIMGAVTGVFVDAEDHVWVTHLIETLTPEELSPEQDPPIGTCCFTAPSVVEFDENGNIVGGFGMPEDGDDAYPHNPHGIFVDHNDFVWVGSYANHRVQKFTKTGELMLTLGTYNEAGTNSDTSLLGGPAGIWVDPGTNEAFIADGYRNRRVIVFDGETGEYKRHWGANGAPPVDGRGGRGGGGAAAEVPEIQQFSTVHGITGSNDGLIYVADRRGNRIQVFQQSGEFVSEVVIAPDTRSSGSAFVPVLSVDADQEWLYMADGTNHKVWTVRRSDLEVMGSFGQGGHYPGQMLRPHGMSIDSQGNLYVGEASTGRRVQKFSVTGGE